MTTYISRHALRALLLACLPTLMAGCGPAAEPGGATSRQAVVRATGTPTAALAATGVTATALVVSGLPASVVAGTATGFQVSAVDAARNVVPTYTGTVHLASNFPQVTMPADYQFTAADAGVHTFTFTPTASGTQAIWANDTVTTSITGETNTTVVAAAGTRYVISNLTNGTALNLGVPATFDVTAYDTWWNQATSYAGSAIVTSGDPAAVLPTPAAFAGGVATGVRITFGTAGGQSVTATDSVLATMTDTAWATVAAGPSAAITAPAVAVSGTAGLTASVSAQAGVTYAWSIVNGTITAGAGTSSVTFTAGSAGTLGLTCVVTRVASGATSTGTATVTVTAVAGTPTISAPASVAAGSTGNVASVGANAGMTYRWTITGGTITSAGGAAGVTSGTTNTVTFTAGTGASVALTCAEVDPSGTAGPAASATVTVVAAPVKPTITAPANVTTLLPGSIASVVARAGMTYRWTITRGTITAGAGTGTVTFTPGAVGTLTLTCAEVNAAGTASAAASKSVKVVAAPVTPAITAASPVSAGATGLKASVVARTGMTYAWTIAGGSITSAGGTAGVTAGGKNTITYTAGPAGLLALTCAEVNAAGTASVPATASVTVNAVVTPPVTPTIATASPVTAGQAGLTAAVTARTGMTYAWTIAGGTITSAGGAAGVTSGTTNTVTLTAGPAGTLTLTCAESNGTTSSATASAAVTVAPVPATPAITAASPITAGSTGNVASVTANAGMTYAWTITGGTITSAGGAAGVTSGGVNAITFTAGTAGSVSLGCAEVNAAGAASVPATASVTVNAVVTPPVTPTIATASLVTAGQAGLTASVAARAGMSYAWTIAGGTITSAGGASGVTSGTTNTVTITAGPAGTLTLTCAESNGTTSSATASATVTVAPAPATPAITAPATALPGATGLTASVTARAGMTYAWTIAGGTITSAGGAAGVISGGVNAITFTAGAAGSVSLGCAEVNVAGTASTPGTAAVAIAAPAGTGHLYAVAHQDDDVIFFDPDIEDSLHSGVPTRVVWVIAGSSGDGTAAWTARENQARNAVAQSAGLASSWSCAPRTFLGNKQVAFCSLAGAPAITTAFVRIPDGSSASLWATSSGAPFYVAPAARLTTADGTTTYTHAELIQLLGALIADFAPARIGTMDSTLAYGDDHQDHVASALFTLEAARQWGTPHAFRIYRGYSVDLSGWGYTSPLPEVADLSDAELAEKDRIMGGAYGLSCLTGGFASWCSRHYAITRVAGGTGALVEPGGFCVGTAGGSGAAGAAAVIAPCSGAVSQRWTVGTTGALSNGSGRCLAVGANGVSVALADCAATASQGWLLFSNGQLRGPGSSCLGLGADGVSLEAQVCDADRSTNRYLPLASQQFTQRSAALAQASYGTQLSDADLGAAAAGASATLRLADVDGDGLADACVRLPAGLACALGQPGGGFGPLTIMSTAFSDAAGFGPDAYGSTLQLADLNGDGRADACLRGPSGLVCALAGSGGAGFGPATVWSAGTDFSDAAGFAAAAGYYRTVRLADVDGDGYADACARTAAGVVCALNTRAGTFAAATLWSAGEFTDAGGWLPDRYGTTLQFADLNGDGRADLCGRAADGLRCALSTGSGFTRAHHWSFRDDFTDAAGWSLRASAWGSVRLGDVNGDGLADACGRSPSGLVCALSNGAGFDDARVLVPGLGDLAGWQPDLYGASVTLGDLNHDGRMDVCARGPNGVSCAGAP